MIRQIVRHSLLIFDHDIFIVLIRKSAQDEHPLTIIHDGIEVFGSEFDFLRNDAGIDPDLGDLFCDRFDIFLCQDSTHEISPVFQIDVIGKYTADQGKDIACFDFDDRRVGEDVSEREGFHVGTLD